MEQYSLQSRFKYEALLVFFVSGGNECGVLLATGIFQTLQTI